MSKNGAKDISNVPTFCPLDKFNLETIVTGEASAMSTQSNMLGEKGREVGNFSKETDEYSTTDVTEIADKKFNT